MNPLLLLLAISTAPAANPPPLPPVVACAADRFRPLVDATGTRGSWPVAPTLPESVRDEPGLVLSDSRLVADGYTHTLHVDPSTHSAYVVRQGGIAGFRTVYGPLPLAGCPRAPPRNLVTGKPPRGTP